jgi:hypothetical protein
MELKDSLLCSQEKVVGLYPEADESNPQHHNLFLQDKPLILSSHLRHSIPNYFFPSAFSTKILSEFLISPTLAEHCAVIVAVSFLQM